MNLDGFVARSAMAKSELRYMQIRKCLTFHFAVLNAKKEIRVDIMQLKMEISIGRSIGLLRNEK